MGSVRHRMSEPRHDCNIVLVGDHKVGKSALLSRFIHNKFNESYKSTSSFDKLSTSAIVSNRRVKFTIWDSPGSKHTSATGSREMCYREADVIMLCYKISDPNTLFSALNFWWPEIRSKSRSAPIVLVGCQSDLRRDREVLSALSKNGRAPVSADQALSFSRQMAATIYIETSSKMSSRAAISAFEVAALTSMGKIVPKVLSPWTCDSAADLTTTKSGNDSSLLEEHSDHFWDQVGRTAKSETPTSSRTASLSSARSQARSNTSIPSLLSSGSNKTPKAIRKSASYSQHCEPDKMITIKCQRLTSDKTYEEIEVEVPAPIYETIQLYNDSPPGLMTRNTSKEKRSKSFSTKLRRLFSKN